MHPYTTVYNRSAGPRRVWLKVCEALVADLPQSPALYRPRNLAERFFRKLKHFRRDATRYDRRADIFLSTVLLAAVLTWWIN